MSASPATCWAITTPSPADRRTARATVETTAGVRPNPRRWKYATTGERTKVMKMARATGMKIVRPWYRASTITDTTTAADMATTARCQSGKYPPRAIGSLPVESKSAERQNRCE